MVKVIFVRSLQNDSDIWTKNASEAIYRNHTDKFMEKRNDEIREDVRVS